VRKASNNLLRLFKPNKPFNPVLQPSQAQRTTISFGESMIDVGYKFMARVTNDFDIGNGRPASQVKAMCKQQSCDLESSEKRKENLITYINHCECAGRCGHDRHRRRNPTRTTFRVKFIFTNYLPNYKPIKEISLVAER